MNRSLAALALLLLASCDRPAGGGPPAAAATDPGEGFSRTSARTIDLGTFEVASDRMLVSDPCYPKEEQELHGVAGPVRRGTWKAAVVRIEAGNWGPRNAELVALHAAATGPPSWQAQKGALPVDSGQLGIFDRARYGDPAVVPRDHAWKGKPIDPDRPWYSLCCEQTLGEHGGGVVPFGTVSSSGVGDGSYEWHLWTVKDEVVGVRVVFLPE